ncbi:MAG: N-acetylmuramoyl-L-alanine amidase [Saprospiraceae bacterium]|nr:N-acetylmuramoyl-L-alanine amidase [Saprospiraceae bacterium]
MKRIILFFVITSFVFITSFNPSYYEYRIKTIVLDAGHGGDDPGAIGKNCKEKDLTLKMTLKVGKYIEDNLKDVKVIYTRKTDVAVELYKRPKIANDNKADLFISIHCNAVASTTPYGTETFVMGIAKNEASKAVAKKENSVILLEDNYETKYEGFDPNSPEGEIILSFYTNQYLEQSAELATMVQKQFTNKVGRHDRGVKQAGYLVLWKTTMPSILIETGFISNLKEEAYLMSEKGQDEIALAIYHAIKEYKLQKEGKPGGNIRVEEVKNEASNEKIEAVNNSEQNEKTDGVEDLSTYFSVQFTSSSKEKPNNSSDFKGLKEVDKYFQNGLYKYYVGKTKTLQDAVELQKKVQAKGFSDAFIIAFNNGKRITPKEAVELLK